MLGKSMFKKEVYELVKMLRTPGLSRKERILFGSLHSFGTINLSSVHDVSWCNFNVTVWKNMIYFQYNNSLKNDINFYMPGAADGISSRQYCLPPLFLLLPFRSSNHCFSPLFLLLPFSVLLPNFELCKGSFGFHRVA